MTALNLKIEKLCDELRETASKRDGGAWTTGSCVVGRDMASGLEQAKNIIDAYNFTTKKTEAVHCQELAALIKTGANEYPYHDSEGYAAGTMVQLAYDIKNIGGNDTN
ncbi:hypothetical protein CXF85_19430 [Colwellia sp. 75C3]|uniref:hypothetical protein n=1 Tax=Colwellia sp. 75C3 TaxID=888425 RepID=UPI000C340709|nr:hypothetical protein [Colwellia sp. 75C3]PKG80943.1 hypothetical protein CXF85_19430 [Colwellia sp. 75C3]